MLPSRNLCKLPEKLVRTFNYFFVVLVSDLFVAATKHNRLHKKNCQQAATNDAKTEPNGNEMFASSERILWRKAAARKGIKFACSRNNQLVVYITNEAVHVTVLCAAHKALLASINA